MALPWEEDLAVALDLLEPMDQVEQVSAVPALPTVHQAFHQAEQETALDMGLPVSSPMADLDT